MALQGRLAVIEGFLSAKEYVLPLEGDFMIGRNRRMNIRIMARTISRKHAKITFRNGHYTITDLDSKGGVIVNDRRISTTVLRHGDRIQIGHVKFRFWMEEPKSPPSPLIEFTGTSVVLPPRPEPEPPPPTAAEAEPEQTPALRLTAEESALVGQTLGDIKLISALARGRRTVVYKGTQAVYNRVLAVKALQPQAANNREMTSWFIEGAKRASALSHEDIVAPLGGGTENSVTFLYLPFMEHGNALERFRTAAEEGVPAAKRALEAVVHVTRALEYAQSMSTLHLGLRPSKILFNEHRRAKVAGLGFDNTPSAPGALITPEVRAYLAPEQFGTIGEVTIETDIFSLGATFHYMLTGRHPMRDRVLRIPSPKQINPVVPDSVCRIAEKMVAPEPQERYRSYSQLLHDLRWALRGEAWPHA
jgi:pSer/pThr/pTyr-binding forkhead associated (FHA) protein